MQKIDLHRYNPILDCNSFLLPVFRNRSINIITPKKNINFSAIILWEIQNPESEKQIRKFEYLIAQLMGISIGPT